MIAILQPHVPHYREQFFEILGESEKTDIVCYDLEESKNNNFSEAKIPVVGIQVFQIGPLLLYNPFQFLQKKYDILVLMLHFGHLTTWFILLTKWIHHKKIILWGQGISVKRYLEEEKNPDWKLKWMIALSNGVWIYTEKEAEQWKKLFPKKPIVALNNTLQCSCNPKPDIAKIEGYKHKHHIIQKRILIFSARFENPYRRTDLLLEVINHLNPDKVGFIIIGSGSLKPDFSKYKNVYDFGKLYDDEIKGELFSMADIYFQPGWVGLSIVEAMSYALPIFTFRRSEDIKQCVEYSYIENGVNGCLFTSTAECMEKINSFADSELKTLGRNAQAKVLNQLNIELMVNAAISII